MWERTAALAPTVAERLPAPGRRLAIIGCGTSYFVAQALGSESSSSRVVSAASACSIARSAFVCSRWRFLLGPVAGLELPASAVRGGKGRGRLLGPERRAQRKAEGEKPPAETGYVFEARGCHGVC